MSRGWAVDVAALALLKLAIGAWVLARGFSHVSDDDYARTVIAQQFAHAPHLDPSGTSWLPLPFWVEGTAMALAGRTMATAGAVAVAMGVVGVCVAYLAHRAAGVRRPVAALAALVAMALPWNAWLGVATVPEGWVGACTAAALIAAVEPRMRPWSAAALFAAALSRYEAWPACAALAVMCVAGAVGVARSEGVRSSRSRRRVWTDAVCAVVAVAGPLAWMAHNATAHGSALHFLARVSAFRHAIGAADVPMRDKLLGYPRSLVADTPEAAALGLVGAIGLALDRRLRLRWAAPAATALAIVGFLVWGDVHDGAPTHHPARALVAVWWILIGMGVDAGATAARKFAVTVPRAAVLGAGAVLLAGWSATLIPRWNDAPGRSDYDDRRPQIARGLDMRARDVKSAAITPCAFEHFALLAAWGAPERADVSPRTGAPPTAACPRVVEK